MLTSVENCSVLLQFFKEKFALRVDFHLELPFEECFQCSSMFLWALSKNKITNFLRIYAAWRSLILPSTPWTSHYIAPLLTLSYHLIEKCTVKVIYRQLCASKWLSQIIHDKKRAKAKETEFMQIPVTSAVVVSSPPELWNVQEQRKSYAHIEAIFVEWEQITTVIVGLFAVKRLTRE